MTKLQLFSIAVILLVAAVGLYFWITYDPSPGNWGQVRFR